MTPSGTRTRSMVMPLGRVPAFSDGADRIGKLAHDVDAVGHSGDDLGRQGEPVEKRGVRSGGFHLGDVLGIGRQNARFTVADRSAPWR